MYDPHLLGQTCTREFVASRWFPSAKVCIDFVTPNFVAAATPHHYLIISFKITPCSCLLSCLQQHAAALKALTLQQSALAASLSAEVALMHWLVCKRHTIGCVLLSCPCASLCVVAAAKRPSTAWMYHYCHCVKFQARHKSCHMHHAGLTLVFNECVRPVKLSSKLQYKVECGRQPEALSMPGHDQNGGLGLKVLLSKH